MGEIARRRCGTAVPHPPLQKDLFEDGNCCPPPSSSSSSSSDDEKLANGREKAAAWDMLDVYLLFSTSDEIKTKTAIGISNNARDHVIHLNGSEGRGGKRARTATHAYILAFILYS